MAKKRQYVREEWGEDGLSVRERLFVEYLLGPAGGNATAAALMAGYSTTRNAAGVRAIRVLSRQNVQEAISHAIAKRKDSPDWLRNSLVEIAASSMANFISVTPKGKVKVDFKKAAAAGALGHIREYDPKTGKIKLHDTIRAKELLLKLAGKLVERHEHTGANGKAIESVTTHKFDHDAYRELFRGRFAAGRNGHGVASENSN